jgi:hypothetical protein
MRCGAPEPFYDLRRALSLDLHHDPVALLAAVGHGPDLAAGFVPDRDALAEGVEALPLVQRVTAVAHEPGQNVARFQGLGGRCVRVESNHGADLPKTLTLLAFSPVCWGT